MKRNVIETVMGAVVLVVACVFMVFAFLTADLRQIEGYEVTAQFTRIDGLNVGSDVMVSGVRVGSVTGLRLDPLTYLAEATISVDPSIELPEDTVAVITSESLLGGKFLALDPGGSDIMIPPGGSIGFTQSAPNFEQLLGQVIYQLQGLTTDQTGGG